MSRTVAWNKLLIKHSRERKLVVNASPSPTGNLKRTRTRNESEAARLEATLRLFLDIVVVEMRRVVYLRVRSDAASITTHQIFRTTAPILENFVIGDKDGLSHIHSHSLFANHCPNIVVLGLYGHSITSIPFGQSLALGNLCSLSLSDISFDRWPTCSELLAILRNCERITYLRLQHAGPSADMREGDGRLSTISLPALEKFTVDCREKKEYLQATRILLCHIQAPHLKSFSLSCFTSAVPNVDFSALVPRSLCPVGDIKDLRLSYPSFLSLRFVVCGEAMVADDVEQGQFSFCFTEELREDTHGRLALSAMGTWGIAEVDRITILLRPASKRHAGSEPQFIRSPPPARSPRKVLQSEYLTFGGTELVGGLGDRQALRGGSD